MPLADSFVETLVSSNPQEQAFRFLTHLLRDAQATGGALMIEAQRKPRIWVGLNSGRAHETMRHWHDALKLLSGSGLHVDDGLLLAALHVEGSFVGVLQLEGAQSFDATRHADHLAVFGYAIELSTRPRQASYGVEDLVGGDDRRTEAVLRELLERHEWNIARVAREMGNTRRTVYQRMERWGIFRKKVSKA